MEADDITAAGVKVVTGLRDSLLKPMHDSLADKMDTQHAAIMCAVQEMPINLLLAIADAIKNIKWE